MKTIGMYYAEPGRVDLREFDIADPDVGEAQVEVRATGICAYDLALFKGVLPPYLAYPFLHGHEGAGIVRRIGSRVSSVQEGDKVAVWGNSSRLFGHHTNVSETMVARIPEDVQDLEYWLAEPIACVVNGVEWSKLVPGDRVAIVGTGFMGLIFAQCLKHSLCDEVIAIDLDERRLELARQFGASRTINVSTEEGKQSVEELKSDPVDVSIEAAGTQATLDLSYQILRAAGRLNIFGSHRGSPSRTIDAYEWHHKGIEVYNTSPRIAPDFARVFRRTVRLMGKGIFDLEPLVTHVAPPEKAQELFETAVAQRDGYIKGAVKWPDAF